MTELERELLALGGAVEYPPTPNLGPRVRTRLEERRARLGLPARRALAVAFVVLLAIAGALLAVPGTRSAIFEWLGLKGVAIERIETTPEGLPVGFGLGLGQRVTLDEARERVPYEVVIPERLGAPDSVYVRRDYPRQVVSLAYGTRDELRYLFTQFRGDVRRIEFYKGLPPGTQIERLTVDGGRGYWIAGEVHVFGFVDESGQLRMEEMRLAGNVLLWERGDLTLRVEGARTKAEALAIAASVR